MPFLKSVTVSGFRGFVDEQSLQLAIPDPQIDGSGLTVLVGPNNGGKSSFLEAMEVTSKVGDVAMPRHWRRFASEFQASFKLNWDDGLDATLCSHPQNPEQMKAGGSAVGNKSRPLSLFTPQRLLPVQIQIEPAKRDTLLREQPAKFAREGAPDYLHRRVAGWRTPGNRFQDLIKRVLDFDLKYYAEGQRLYVRVNGDEHDPRGLGTGVVAVLTIIDMLHDAPDQSTILIDEPESSLHPTYQRRLLTLFKEESRRLQIVYATHSPHFIDWDAILGGACLARIHRGDGPSRINALSKESARDLAGLTRNLRNPHILGMNAKEVFFINDGVLLCEGQDDVVYYQEMARQLSITLPDQFYGWGAGGADNIPRLMRMFRDLGYKRVTAILDKNKDALGPRIIEQFPEYGAIVIPTDDVRDKADPLTGKLSCSGLCNTSGVIHSERLDAVKYLFKVMTEPHHGSISRIEL